MGLDIKVTPSSPTSGKPVDYGPHADPSGQRGRTNPINVAGLWLKQRARVDPMAEFNDLDRYIIVFSLVSFLSDQVFL